jgi:N-acyl amino acid synthase of PEP-CTERM/exosortase system
MEISCAGDNQVGGAMSQNYASNQSIDVQSHSTPAVSDPQSQTGKFVFPGSLRLNTKLLLKEDNVKDYESLYSLRYQVYCHEAHFLDPEDYSDGLESDEYDSVAAHFLATKEDSDEDVIGTVRLVKWTEHLSFPTAMYFKSLIERLKHLRYPLDSTAEISRLCISKQYRRSAMDGLLGIERYADGDDKRRRYPVIIFELFKKMYLASRHNLGITHWIATFEDSLYRLLKRYGFKLELLIPDEIDYYGKVKIYGISLNHLESDIKSRRPDLYAFFREPSDYA